MKVKAILLLGLMVPMGCATVNVTPDAYRLNNANHKVTSVVSDDFTTVVNRTKTMLKECYPQTARTVIEGGSFLDVFTNSIEQKNPKTISIIRERAYDYKTMGFIPTGKGKVPVFIADITAIDAGKTQVDIIGSKEDVKRIQNFTTNTNMRCKL